MNTTDAIRHLDFLGKNNQNQQVESAACITDINIENRLINIASIRTGRAV